MSKLFMDQCVKNKELQRYVRHFAYKVKAIYPCYMDVEDAENELWFSLFRAISNRYDGKTSLFLFAKRSIFSKYGNLSKDRSNASKLMNETYSSTTPIPVIDTQYKLVEANYTLDQIEKDLKERQGESRQYTYAVAQFGYLREGKTMTEFCEDIGLSRSYGYFIFSNIIKKCAEKYHEEGITMGYGT